MEEKVKIKGTNDREVACALADLAGFPDGSIIGRINNIYHREFNKECAICFHRDTLDKAEYDNVHPMLLGPDFAITQIYRPPKPNEAKWQPTDEYLIDFGHRIDSSLIGK